MPSGKVHARCSLYLSLPSMGLGAVGGLLFTGSPVMAAICCGVGCLLGVLLTPDLDQESINSAEYFVIKYTMGLGYLWTMIWFPYALLTDHRGRASHWPVLGTVGRLMYLSIWLMLFAFLGLPVPQIPYVWVLWAVVGLMVSDVAHWAMDVHFGDPFDRKRKR